MRRTGVLWGVALFGVCSLATLPGCYQRPDIAAHKSLVPKKNAPKRPAVTKYPVASVVKLPEGTRQLNVRVEPGLGEAVAFTLQQDTAVDLTKTMNGWFALAEPVSGRKGWAFGAYLELTGVREYRSLVVPESGLQLWRGPSEDAELDRRAGRGERLLLKRRADSAGFTEVLMPDGARLYTRLTP